MGECILTRRAGKSLPALSNPAKAAQILKDYQAIDQNGNILTGVLNAFTAIKSSYLWKPRANEITSVGNAKVVIPVNSNANSNIRVYILSTSQQLIFYLNSAKASADFETFGDNIHDVRWDKEADRFIAPNYDGFMLAIFS